MMDGFAVGFTGGLLWIGVTVLWVQLSGIRRELKRIADALEKK